MDYYVCIRNTIQKFDELASKVAIEGGTLNLGVLSLSGVFFRYSFFEAAMVACLGSIATTIIFGLMAMFYSKLLGISVETAKKMEDEIFPQGWNAGAEGKKLTYNLDKLGTLLGIKLAGKHTWKVVIAEFVVLLFLEIALFIFYVLHLLPPTNC